MRRGAKRHAFISFLGRSAAGQMDPGQAAARESREGVSWQRAASDPTTTDCRHSSLLARPSRVDLKPPPVKASHGWIKPRGAVSGYRLLPQITPSRVPGESPDGQFPKISHDGWGQEAAKQAAHGAEKPRRRGAFGL